ncbi:hypothetical protein PR048_004735 [Dryococelus australis]|uniref:Uncharacterized protein n=1 Tax=Dryococelus australis TaxID=614101 RepID=A0ABQ9I695_9NEOP|nr:hypothetical protein PR048_004735 [Dryococelus australis]
MAAPFYDVFKGWITPYLTILHSCLPLWHLQWMARRAPSSVGTSTWEIRAGATVILCTLIGPAFSRMDTSFRPAIVACEHLVVTLHFFGIGDLYYSLMYMLKISKQVISSCVP